MRRALLCTAAVVYLVTLGMNVAGLPRVVCDMGNHAFVLACLVFVAASWRQTRDTLLLAFMTLTFLADVTTGFPQTFALGVVLFFASQIVFSFILWRHNGERRAWPLRITLVIVGLVGIYAAGIFSPMYAFGIVYFMWFLGNAIQTLAAREWENSLVKIAMVLYILGDICLIANLLAGDGEPLRTVLAYGTWVPYLPAVLMIALMGVPARDQ